MVEMGDTVMDEGDGADAPRMVLVCGVMASGKSTFAAALRQALGGGWQVVAQDDIPQTNAHAAACNVVLGLRGESAVVDRINSDAAQRRAFCDVALRNRAGIVCVHVAPPVDRCVAQLRRRGDNHRRFKWSPENAQRVRQTAKAFEPPDVAEGFSHVYRATTDEELASTLRCVVALANTRPLAPAAPGAKRSLPPSEEMEEAPSPDVTPNAKRRKGMKELARRTGDMSLNA
eukprot:TRINITY_DN5590_c0_g1_i1.p2 TRINITY_DN5590_c0_g1~~TRINITY_DN5590_c0_g1_i1.p2  ORF type:complete len:231 (+),score=82.79 TRINITY_DN5590_c0_g1_i1:88-780(+)